MLPENQHEYQSGANGTYSQTMEIPNLTLSDLEFRQIKDIVWKTTGISLSDNKKALVISRLARRLRELNMQSFYKYINRLRADTDELLFMINCITTNLTRFYREKGQFAFLKDTVLPEILEAGRSKQEKTLRLWSAGCSTGEEVYTLLFEIMAYFKGRIPPALDIKILGSDIDTGALQKAGAGLYSEEEVKGLQETEIANYFDRVSEDQFTIKNHLKKYVTFLKMNLVYDAFIFKHKMDAVFCRNVVIYFDKDTRAKVYRKFHSVLAEPGYFFSGHSESLFQYSHLFKFIGKSVYKKVV